MLSIQNQKLAIPLSRIMIIGRPGSGKSTLAIKLQKILNIPLFHLDKYFFSTHWKPRDYQEFLLMQQQLVDKPQWIIDGNSSKSFEMRYAQADLCLYFNFSKWLCYWGVFKRLFHKHPDIDDRAPYCHETVRWELLKYMWDFEDRMLIIEKLSIKYPDVRLVELHSDRDVKNFQSALISRGNVN